jgi:antitoxin VapB
MKTAKLFRNGRSQAVRLPREFRFEGDRVFIRKCGKGVLLLPAENAWDAWIENLSKFSPDFMADGRQQPKEQKRRSAFE